MSTTRPDSTDLEPIGAHGRPRFFTPDSDSTVQRAVILRVATYESRPTDFGERLVVVGEEPGTGVIWSRMLTGAVLINEFARQRPAVGELVRLEYEGKGTVQSGRFTGKEFARWSVQVLRGPMEPDWEALGGDDPEVHLVPAGQEPARVIEADVEIDDAGLPNAATTIGERSQEAFRNEPAY